MARFILFVIVLVVATTIVVGLAHSRRIVLNQERDRILCKGGKQDQWMRLIVCEAACDTYELKCYEERKEGCRCGGLTYRRKDGLCVLREDCRENKF